MPKTVYYCASTLDGYIADRDDGIDWLTGYSGTYEGGDLESHPLAEGGSYDRFYDGVGALVSGSTSYEFVLGHVEAGNWPYHGRHYWVLSSRDLAPPKGEGDWVHVVDAEVVDLLGELRDAAGGRDLWVVGGGNVASQFADAGLLDEVHVTVVPVVLGEGKPLFDHPVPGPPMRLLGISPYGNGMVELRYAIQR